MLNNDLSNTSKIIYNKKLFTSFGSIKSFSAINKNLINSLLKKGYICNVYKSNLLSNNQLKSFSEVNRKNSFVKLKTNNCIFKQVLFKFVSKNEYYNKKTVISKLRSYRS
jgi:hypothetical protein